MAIPLLKTKLYIPPVRPDLVSRPHLVEGLNSGLHRKLTLLSAPPGFGKSTLLSEWVHCPNRTELCPHVAWFSLDEADNDPTRFWTYLVAALQTTHPDIGGAALASLQAPQPAPIESLLANLLNELAEIEMPSALVLDDFHYTIAMPQILDALLFLVENLPPSIHLVLSTRADPPWPLGRMRARGEVTELRDSDLRFTATEAATFLNDVMDLGLSPQDIAALERRTEGWIAGLQMAALSMRGRDHTAFITAFGGSHRFVLDYLVEEVLDRQPQQIQEFLLRTSILDRLTAPLCEALSEVGEEIHTPNLQTPTSNIQTLLDHLESSNLFLIPLDDERRWYRYHHLFSDLLRSRLEQGQPELVPLLHRRASEWYESVQLVEEAVSHALVGEDTERAAALIERSAMQMITHSKLTTLARWIEALPKETVQARPWLSVYGAWTRYWTGRRQHVDSSLQNAEQALQSMPKAGGKATATLAITETERQHIEGHIAAIRAFQALPNEEISLVVEMAEKALDLLPEGEYMRIMAALILGAAYWGLGDVVASEEAFTWASTSARGSGYRFLEVSSACYAGMQQAKQGRLHQAHETYERALFLARGPEELDLPAAGYPAVKLNDLLREWNDLEAAGRSMEKDVELCVQWAQVDSMADSFIAQARLQLAIGDTDGAHVSLQRADDLMAKTRLDPWLTCWLEDCRLRLWLSTGNLEVAVRWASASGLGIEDEFSYQHDLHHINLARVLVAQGQRLKSEKHLKQAMYLLTRLLKAAEKANWVHKTIQILILQAIALEESGMDEKALTSLERALSLAEPGSYVRTFVDEGRPMAQLLERVATRRTGADYATKLLEALCSDKKPALQPLLQPQESIQLVDPLSDRELQVLRLLATHLTRREISEELYISVNTVRSHVKSIYSKLDVHRRAEAIERAKKLGLI
jgi:LuxR family maltose regulon positive regulatory protein